MKRRMRRTIVHAITRLELGGAQEFTLLTCRELDRSRFDVHLVTGRGGLLDEEARSIPDIRLHFVDALVREIHPSRDLRAFIGLRGLFGEIARNSSAPILVHTHSSKAGILGRWAATRDGVAARVHSIHGFGFHERQRAPTRLLYQTLERRMAKVTDAFTADARENLRLAGTLGLLDGKKPTLFLPPGIDPSEYHPVDGERERVRVELGIDAEAPLVGTLACLKPQKAPLDLVRIAARAVRDVPRLHFFLAGDGELRSEVEAEIARLGLGDRFHLLGWRRDVRALLAAMDVFLLPSLHEGLPRAILQAMAAGKPVIASRVDGVPEAVDHGVTGYVVEPGDLDAFARRICELIHDRERARAMGAEASPRADAFDWRRGLVALESLYDRLLGEVDTA